MNSCGGPGKKPRATRAQPAQKLACDRFATRRHSNKAEATDRRQVFAAEEQPRKWGTYTPNLGFKVANTDRGDLSISLYSYARYLNQLGLDSTYKDAFGNVKSVQQRQDFQLNKVQIKFLGWILDPKFRYFLYAWSSNASQGLGAQVVLAGNLNYAFNKSFNVGAGIRSLPGTRSVEGNFPFWLGVDTRLIADEFFRPSYTSGVWAWGKITNRLDYIAMIGNNLSTLGVSAAQLNNGFNTVSTVARLDAQYWTTLASVLVTSKTIKNWRPVSAATSPGATRTDRNSQTVTNSRTHRFGSKTGASSSCPTSSVPVFPSPM